MPGMDDYMAGGAPPTKKASMDDYMSGSPSPTNVPQWKKTVSKYTREGLKGLGMVGGAIAGAPAAPESLGLSSVAGAGLGYAIGNKAADIVDVGLGINKGAPLKQQAKESAKDVLTGATTEMGGQVAAPIIGKGIGLAKDYLKTPMTAAKTKAGELLNKAYEVGPEEAGNAAKFENLQERQPGLPTMTRGQQIGGRKAGMFEQSLSADSSIADTLTKQDTEARQGSLETVMKTLGLGKEAPSRVPEAPAGASLYSRIEKAYAPIKQAENEAYAAIPKYEMPTTTLDQTISDIKSKPMAEKAESELNSAVNYIKGMPKDTVSMREVSKSLGNDIYKYTKAGDDNTAYPLKQLKAAIDKDIESLGDAANTGKIAVYQNKIVYPEQIQKELDAAKQELLFPPGGGMRAASDQKAIESKIAALQDTLNNAQPADDAAAAIKNAVGISKDKFQRFKTDEVWNVRKKGQGINERAVPDEEIRKHFSTVHGYSSLERAVGPDDARELMRSHFQNELRGTGEHFNPKQALNYYRKNEEVLKRAGLDGEAKDLVKNEIPNELRRMLDAKRLEPGTTDQPYFTAQEVRQIGKDYGGLIHEAYGAKAVQAFKDYHEVLTRLGWNKNQGYAAGSMTAEKFLNNPEWFLKEGEVIPHPLKRITNIFLDVLATSGGAAAGAAMHGWEGAALGSAGGFALRRGYTEIRKDAANRVIQLLREAVVNPEVAEMLMKVAKAGGDKQAMRIAAEGIAKLGTIGTAMGVGRKEEKPEDNI